MVQLRTLALSRSNFNSQVLVALDPKTCEKIEIHITSNQDENLSTLLGKYIHSKSSNPYNLIGIAEDIDLSNKFALYIQCYMIHINLFVVKMYQEIRYSLEIYMIIFFKK